MSVSSSSPSRTNLTSILSLVGRSDSAQCSAWCRWCRSLTSSSAQVPDARQPSPDPRFPPHYSLPRAATIGTPVYSPVLTSARLPPHPIPSHRSWPASRNARAAPSHPSIQHPTVPAAINSLPITDRGRERERDRSAASGGLDLWTALDGHSQLPPTATSQDQGPPRTRIASWSSQT